MKEYEQSLLLTILTTAAGLPLHHPWRAALPGDGRVPAAGGGADAEPAPPHQERAHAAHTGHDGEPLPRDGPRHALHAGTHTLPARHR